MLRCSGVRPAARQPRRANASGHAASRPVTRLPFTDNALKVITKRYLQRDASGALAESPEGMYERVAKALAQVEQRYGATASSVQKLEREFYDVMTSFSFTPAGRTLANAGTTAPVVANCVVLHIQDSMEDIFETLKHAALLQKAGSGIGFPLHLLRPAGSRTVASAGTASGPVSFLHVYNSAFGVIKQQNRHGANMAVMRIDHPDILEFIHCKDKEGDIRNFNISVGLTDEFMRQVKNNDTKPWMCKWKGASMAPRRITRNNAMAYKGAEPVEITAKALFSEIVKSAWRTGEPGCVFLDAVNRTNPLPLVSQIEACNPCGEQFLHDGDVCNLGAINLEKFASPSGGLDKERLRAVTKTAVHMLDNVIDLYNFPVEKNRRIGLGVMGFADLLYQLNIGYATPEGRALAEQTMQVIGEAAGEKSAELGKAKGVFAAWDKSVFARTGEPRRNAALTNVPPTGTISMLWDVSGGIEPYFALAYHYKNILGGDADLSYVNKHLKKAFETRGVLKPGLLEDIIARGTLQHRLDLPEDIRRTFVTAMDISADDHILMQAAFQRYTDNAISKTINFPSTASQSDIERGYLLAWENGCKGCTVYRDASRVEQVLNLNSSNSTPAENGAASKSDTSASAKKLCSHCQTELIYSSGCLTCPICGASKCEL